MTPPDLRRRFNFGLALWVLALGAAGLFLAAPLEGTGLSPIIVEIHAQARAAIDRFSPYLLVAALGMSVGLGELSSTFSDYPREAIATRWGQDRKSVV